MLCAMSTKTIESEGGGVSCRKEVRVASNVSQGTSPGRNGIRA